MEKSPTPSAPTFKGATPILPVASLGRSLKFYIGVLGFSLDWQVDESGFASVSRDGCHLFLCEGDQGHPGTWVWVGVTDVTALYGECQARGAVIRHPPTNYPWALEMQIQDPDGNVLRLGSEPLADHPIGEWLDMHGKTWLKGADGAWSKT